MKACYQIAFATDPFCIVRCAAGESRLKERLPEPSDVNRQHQLSRGGQFVQARTETPGSVLIESREMQFALLNGDRRQIIFAQGHNSPPSTQANLAHSVALQRSTLAPANWSHERR
jgi:hypothetical protein